MSLNTGERYWNCEKGEDTYSWDHDGVVIHFPKFNYTSPNHWWFCYMSRETNFLDEGYEIVDFIMSRLQPKLYFPCHFWSFYYSDGENGDENNLVLVMLNTETKEYVETVFTLVK